MKTKLIKILALAVALVAGVHAYADGNIYEIVPCTQSGAALGGPISSVKSPLIAGDTVYFKLRMPRTIAMKTSGRHWTLVHHGMSEIIDDFFSPLSIGIYVSGQRTFARYVNYVDSSADVRDFIFAYQTKPGDFALPIRLAGNDGKPAGYGEASSEYLLMNDDKWTIEDGSGNPATFQFGTTFEVPVSPATSQGRQLDYTLANAGFYVRSINFDPAKESDDFWRMVHSGSTITDSLTPRLVAEAAPTNTVTLYVWSMNEDIVKISGSNVSNVEMTVRYEAGNPIKETVHVGTVTFAAGQSQVNFSDMGFAIEGGDATHVGQFTNLVLSAYTDYSYNKSGVRQVDYVTVPVLCSEALPPTLIVEVDTATAKATGDRYRSTAQVTVYLSQPYDAPLEVTVTPSFENGATANWGDYVRFSKTASEVTTLPAAVPPTVIIPANSTGRQTLFLYALRSDENTMGDGNQIILTPSFDDAAAATFIQDTQPGGLWIDAEKPVIVTPGEGAEISTVSGDNYELTLEVSDTVADLSDTTTGYRVWFKPGTTSKGGFLDGYWIMKDGSLVDRDTLKPLTVSFPTSGDQQAQIYVLSPISGKKSETVTFTAHVAKARTSAVETTDDKGNVYNEGEQATFKVTLSAENDSGATMYAFLKASGNAVAGMFRATPLFVVCNDTDPMTTQGLAINKNQIATQESKVQLLDGLSQDAGGLPITFEVVLCSTPQYNEAAQIAGYEAIPLSITVFNVEPNIKRIEMNGFEADYDGFQFPAVPKGMWQRFQAIVEDKGAYDLETNFQTKWTISRNGQQKGNTTIVGNPLDVANCYSNNFTQAGTWVVKCQVKDKDMTDWSPVTYSVTFQVLDSQRVVISAADSYQESNSKTNITVGLSYWDDEFDAPLVVRVGVGPRTPGRPNPGLFKLDQNYYAETVDGVDYYDIPVTSDNYSGQTIDIVEMDGTDNASFRITGEVTSTTVLPKSETPANEYYLASPPVRVDVYDDLPVCIVTPEPSLEGSTNRIEIAGGLATGYTIRWRIRNDVDNDFTYTYERWTEPGIKITFVGCANAAEGSVSITEPTSGEFTPDFGSAQGDVDLVMLVETKDGTLPPFTWKFTIRPSKYLKTTANGPGGTATSLSSKYSDAGRGKGRGEGHVAVGGIAKPDSGEGYTFTWNCQKALNATVYGIGYKVGAVDDGHIAYGTNVDLYDFAVSDTGKAPVTSGPYHTYRDTIRDSYLYIWLVHAFADNGDITTSVLGDAPVPEIAGDTPKQRPVGLPQDKTGDGGYQDTWVEAVFSKEWRPADNCGDINQDGIPDRAHNAYDFGVTFDGVGDLNDLSGFNDDQDFLPGSSSAGNRLVPNVASDWATQGIAFNAYLEIRGFHEGLNAGYPNADGSDPEPDYSVNEMRAWLEWKGLETFEALRDMADADVETMFNDNIADATADLAAANAGTGGWSPERPTNPTVEDTDDDGIADGYEYWFWYGAKVGYYDRNPRNNGKWQGRLTGRRLNINDLDNYDVVTSDDICVGFDPLVSAVAGGNAATSGSIADRDFDNDGLADLEEYLIGTNPVDCDTDDDGVPDGYEVMWGLNPLADEEQEADVGKRSNPDGDFMAYAAVDDYSIVEFDADLGEGDNHYVYLAQSLEDNVLVGCLLGTGDPADLVWSMGDDIVPISLGDLETLDLSDASNIAEGSAEGLSLIHNQVYKFFGYDPRTAWSGYDPQAIWDGTCQHGYVTRRWCPTCNTANQLVTAQMVGEAGLVTNTRRYTARDEYLFGKYNGIAMRDTVLLTLKASCTNPNVAFNGKAYGDSSTTYSSTVHGADTDENGVPDGWEAYVGYNPVENPGNMDTTLATDDDEDRLSLAGEYSCNDGCKVYGQCQAIADNSSTKSGWFNRFFPTDPNNADTDGDQISDYLEGQKWRVNNVVYSFLYGSPEDDGKKLCFRGGGMNPCSTDTDLDALPDAWEMQYAGLVVTPEGKFAEPENSGLEYTAAMKIADGYGLQGFAAKSNYITGGMDATDNLDAIADFVNGTTARNKLANDEITGTIRDYDFDHDGLANYQEYLVQAVRCWRYDDTETPLMGRALKWTFGSSSPELVEAEDSYLVFNPLYGEDMLETVKNSNLWDEYGADGTYAATLDAYDYKAMGYFAPCANEWDPGYQFNHKDPATGEILLPYGTCYMWYPQTMTECADDGTATRTAGTAYVSTNPRSWDSDNDGMDDFWEVFHGLNPILGSSDVIASAYNNEISRSRNVWTQFASGDFDPVLAPWSMGLPVADPDGDGLRNLDEAINGNLTSPTTYHTDPSPRWMTESSTPASYVSQYYQCPSDLGDYYPWTLNIVYLFYMEGRTGQVGEDSNTGAFFPFEMTEGYDTDGDWVGDGHEVVRNSSAITDPLNSGNPDRRAALYLPGEDACASSTEAFGDLIPQTYDLFRQFTVEAWIKPDEVNRKQTIVERGFAYPASNLVNPDNVWRANFRLEIDENGVVRGMFDNDNALTSATGASSQMLVAGKVEPEVWTHVAMTYDGTNVCMYLDGHLMNTAISHLIPANGVVSVLQNPASTNNYPMSDYYTASEYTLLPGANTVGARRNVVEFDWAGDFSQFTDFFKGYIAEVRFWDGARTSSEIASAYKVRMTPELAAAEREAVYKKWNGSDDEDPATRNDQDGNPTLPAMLVAAFNFQQLPAADSADYVSQYPSGFELGVQNNTTLSEDDIKIGWWEETPLKSTVYKDTRIVPYAHNVVTHLPLFDGACADSVFWSDGWAGYTPAGDNNVKSYAFPNSGNPYKGRYYMQERAIRVSRYTRIGEALPAYRESAEDLQNRAVFQTAHEFIGLDDLVPLGGAYARLDADYWDGQGASTVWTDTGSDADGDGLPDWWETLYGLDKNSAEDWAAEVVWPKDSADGMVVPAWEAYLRDIVAGLQPDGQVHAEYKDKADADGDGLIDWWQNLYALTTGANGDDDGDGLSNYVEYMLTEVFHLKGTDDRMLRFSPSNPYSVNLYVPDYFHRLKELYVGEVFTDHDRIYDMWETKFFKDGNYVSPYSYDADTDEDGDGWSNYAEFQAGTNPCRLNSLGIDGIQVEEYPIPTIELTTAYHEGQNIFGVPLVVKAWRDQEMKSLPDAVWTIGGSGEVAAVGEGGSNVVSGVRYIGMNPMREMQLHFSPGSVVPGSVRFEFKDLNWVLYNQQTGQGIVFDPVTAIWMSALIDKMNSDDTRYGDIVSQTTGDVVGTIDYATGTIQIDFTKVPKQLRIVGDITGTYTDGNWNSLYDLTASYIRTTWQSKITTGGAVSTYYLGEADPRSGDNNSPGHVKEGLNTFVAFYDFDGDGMYTPGEPYGFARDIDIGWNYAKASIELTDTTVVMPRYKLTVGGSEDSAGGQGQGTEDSATDREYIWEDSATDVTVLSNGNIVVSAPGKDKVQVRIVRFAIDNPTNALAEAYIATVFDRVIDLTSDGHQTITEADIMSDPRNRFDLDWDASLVTPVGSASQTILGNILPSATTKMYYGVFVGQGPIMAKAYTNGNMMSRMLLRKFDTNRLRATPLPIYGTLNAPAPTFSWVFRDEVGNVIRHPTYTAFKVRVSAQGFSWTSDYQLMPPCDADGVYRWTPPLRVGAKVPGGTAVFESGVSYTWSISVYNAKFKSDDFVSPSSGFYVGALENSTDYGTAHVAVRYYGPGSVLSKSEGPVRVQAFTTPDFSGAPAGEGYVMPNDPSLSSTDSIKEANAKILGLKAGTYYIRAFIDTVNDGLLSSVTDAAGRSAFAESWGCYCVRDVRSGALSTPKSVTVGLGYGAGEVVQVFIDDCDSDGDSLPDAWEWSEAKSLSVYGPSNIDQMKGGFAMKQSLTGAIEEDGAYSTGLAVLATKNLKSARVAALILGVDATGSDDSVMNSLNSAGSDVVAEPVKVAITAIALDRDAGTVTITADTLGSASGTSCTVSEIYEFPSDGGDLSLTCKVLHCDTIGGVWKEIATKKVDINSTKTDYSFDLGGDVDLSSGFFKVTLEK